MNTPNGQDIRTALERRLNQQREETRRGEEALDALAVQAVQSQTEGLRVVFEDPKTRPEGPDFDRTGTSR